jgi:hypothetical protein
MDIALVIINNGIQKNVEGIGRSIFEVIMSAAAWVQWGQEKSRPLQPIFILS